MTLFWVQESPLLNSIPMFPSYINCVCVCVGVCIYIDIPLYSIVHNLFLYLSTTYLSIIFFFLLNSLQYEILCIATKNKDSKTRLECTPRGRGDGRRDFASTYINLCFSAFCWFIGQIAKTLKIQRCAVSIGS